MKVPVITKETFIDVYNKYPPNGFIRFVYKYFSASTLKKDKWLKNTFLFLLIFLFIFMFLGVIFYFGNNLLFYSALVYLSLLLILGILTFSAFIMNNFRIKKIRKELGNISKEEYNKLADLYL